MEFDIGAKKEIYAMIAGPGGARHRVILISSELPEILGMCDRTLVMREGRLVGEFPREEATEEKIMASPRPIRRPLPGRRHERGRPGAPAD